MNSLPTLPLNVVTLACFFFPHSAISKALQAVVLSRKSSTIQHRTRIPPQPLKPTKLSANKTLKTSTTPTFEFFRDFPGEIRNKIYDYALVDPEVMEITLPGPTDLLKATGTTTTINASALKAFSANKQLYDEAPTLFFRDNRFRIIEHSPESRPHAATRALLAQIGRRGREQLHRLEIRAARHRHLRARPPWLCHQTSTPAFSRERITACSGASSTC
ncbi:uncharacterized protein BDZ99DRAFT_478112 [Mytilinidion resinicola]|uniref:2EXR domain-containing protein n=1 Tax=Mytilinidion resinicola TaxID=574789 RepID=A0A6A6YIM8_9PEZI|nr:uncharacterized protein BDZ99DRAFT_478112 [Mytilinidion resinicola]KAF2808651.1 hypothetical protein BDZ99DRAFT_478112 [Mytilinidion resinicola]